MGKSSDQKKQINTKGLSLSFVVVLFLSSSNTFNCHTEDRAFVVLFSVSQHSHPPAKKQKMICHGFSEFSIFIHMNLSPIWNIMSISILNAYRATFQLSVNYLLQ